MTVLSEATLKANDLIHERTGSFDIAYQPAGVDLRLLSVYELHYGIGRLNVDGSKNLPEKHYKPPYIEFADAREPYWHLRPGAYLCGVYEEVCIPNFCIAYLYSRSSLCRMGCWLETAVFDPGYRGSPGVLLVVHNPGGIVLEQGAPIGQLIFHLLDETTRSYSGSYQYEGLENSGTGVKGT
jgi:dUTP pyrophosphatase